MKIMLILGYSRRYFKLAQKLLMLNADISIVVQQGADSQLVEKTINETKWGGGNLKKYHFALRDYTEYKYFNDVDPEDILAHVEHYRCEIKALNDRLTTNFIRKQNPDILISFGVSYIKSDILDICPQNSYNLHNGLLPYYKGAACHFWPGFFLEPTFVGCTFHRLSSKLDGGDIVHQCLAPMSKGDNLHDISCKATLRMIDDIIKILEIFEKQGYLEAVPQKKNGKMFYSADFREEHLKLIYEFYDNKIIDEYLDGKLSCRIPEIITMF